MAAFETRMETRMERVRGERPKTDSANGSANGSAGLGGSTGGSGDMSAGRGGSAAGQGDNPAERGDTSAAPIGSIWPRGVHYGGAVGQGYSFTPTVRTPVLSFYGQVNHCMSRWVGIERCSLLR